MPELFYAFLTLFVFGIKDVLNKKVLESNDVYSILFIEYFLSILLIVAALFVFSAPAMPPNDILLLTVFSSVIGAASIIAYFSAVQSSHVSVAYAVASSYPFFAAVFSVLFLNEPFLPIYYLALPAIIVALFMLAYKKGVSMRELFTPGVVFALIASVGWAAFFTMAKVVATSINAFNTSVLMESGVFLAIALFIFLTRRKISLSKAPSVKKMVLAYVILFTIGVIAMNLSLLYAGVSLSSMITAAAPGLTAIIAFVTLKEKLSKIQYAGIALLIVSLALLSL